MDEKGQQGVGLFLASIVVFVFLACVSWAPHAQVYLPSNGGTAQGSTSAAPLYTSGAQSCGPTTGTVGAVNQYVELVCPGAANYIVEILPTSGQSAFIGTLKSSDDDVSYRTRRYFKTGVGELDTSVEALDGTQGKLEYRLSGGDSARVTATAYTSGVATVRIRASFNTSMVFLNGPVHTADEAAVRAGRGFRIATQLVTVSASQYFNFALANPAGSGRNVFIQGIWVCQTSTTVLQLTQRPGAGTQATTVTPTTIPPVNRRPDSTTASVVTAAAGASTTAITAGTLGAQIPLQTNGVCSQIQEIDMLTPGQSLGLVVAGVGGGLAGAASSISAYVEEYEEGIN